jgi:hypothetical protein
MSDERSGSSPVDPVVEEYKTHVDRALIRERLKTTPAQQVAEFVASVS